MKKGLDFDPCDEERENILARLRHMSDRAIPRLLERARRKKNQEVLISCCEQRLREIKQRCGYEADFPNIYHSNMGATALELTVPS